MPSFFTFAFLFPALALVALWAAKPLFNPRARTYKGATEIRKLLNPPNVPLGDLLHARAAPNQRLVYAFGLTSTFVSGSTRVHKTFTAHAKALIAGAGDKDHRWRAIALSAEATTHRFLPAPHTITDFATLVQCVTFAVVLCTLFETDLDALVYDDVVYATSIINQRWKDSKIKNAAAMRQDEASLRSLVAHVDRWIVDRDRFPNPLDLILPAFETLWRVVAVTVAHVYRCRDNALHDVVVAFGRNPTEEHFVAFGDHGQHPSMQAIVSEVLRLYPPTRHIVRATAWSGSGSAWWRMWVCAGTEIADIEGVHRSEDYGENADIFDPMRFHPSRMREPRPELFSFGHGRLKCVAAGWAPMAAGIIAATMVLQMDECTVTTGPRIGGRSGWEGWSVGREVGLVASKCRILASGTRAEW